MRDLEFSDNRNVVFRLASDHASVAAGADIQVDAHSPLLRRVQRRMGIETRRRMRHFFCARDFFRELVVFAITLERSFANKTPAFDAEMFLCDRERITVADLRHLHVLNALYTGDSYMRIRCCPQEIAVEPGLLGQTKLFFQIAACIWKRDKLRHFATPTKRNANGVVSMPGRYE